MNKYTILGALILAQIALLYYQLRTDSPIAQKSTQQSLLPIEAKVVEALSIEDAEGTQVHLRKIDQQWQTNNGFSAQQDKVTQLIEKILSLKTNLASAQTDAAAQRFQVAEDTFQRRLTIKTASLEAIKLFVGSGAGARRSYVRLGSEKAIYSLPIAEYELSASEFDWQDLNCLRLATDSIKLVELDDLSLLKVASNDAQSTEESDNGSETDKEGTSAPEWIGKDSSGEITIHIDAVANAVRQLSQLRIEQAKHMPKEPLNERLHLSLQYEQGRRDYRLLQSPEDASQYWLKASDFEGYALKINERNAQQILDNWSMDTLIVKTEAEIHETSTTDAAESAIEVESPQNTIESVDSSERHAANLEAEPTENNASKRAE
jgi:hypothetical protein